MQAGVDRVREQPPRPGRAGPHPRLQEPRADAGRPGGSDSPAPTEAGRRAAGDSGRVRSGRPRTKPNRQGRAVQADGARSQPRRTPAKASAEGGPAIARDGEGRPEAREPATQSRREPERAKPTGRIARGRRQASRLDGGQDQSEGDRRRAAEDARRPERVRDLPRRGQGRPGPAQGAGAGDEAGGRGRGQARADGQDPPTPSPPSRRPTWATSPRARRNVAKELQDLQEKMDEMAKRLDESDPLAASAMREAAQESRKQGTAAKMGEAADQLEKNQMGRPGATRRQVRQDLKELVDADPEPPRTRARPAGQGAEERRGRARQAPPAAGREPQEDPGGPARTPTPSSAADAAQEARQGTGRDPEGAREAAEEAGQAQRRAAPPRPGRRRPAR